MKDLFAQGMPDDTRVVASRNEHGENVLTPPAGQSAWAMFMGNFEDPVIHLLLMADVIALLTGQVVEAIGIAVAILLATGIAFLNEWDAKKKFDVLNETSDDVPVIVLRGGQAVKVKRREVVVGDVVRLDTGDEIPADGTVLDSYDMRVDESALTGESVPVRKDVSGGGENAYPADTLLRGTFVKEGYGHFMVTKVGDATEMGLTARAVMEEDGEPTPLDNQLEKLAKLIGVAGFGFAGAVFLSLVALGTGGAMTSTLPQSVLMWGIVAGMLVGMVKVWAPVMVYDTLSLAGVDRDAPAWLDGGGARSWGVTAGVGVAVCLVSFAVACGMAGETVSLPARTWSALLQYFMVATAIIVAAVPEGLAMSVTLAMAYSMRKMMATGNLVRRLPACETAGSVTRICTDKTGTLTINRMSVSGVHGDEEAIIEGAILNSTAEISGDGFVGNPTECALLDHAKAKGRDVAAIRDAANLENRHPFSSDNKYMSTTLLDGGVRTVLVKGAPERVLDMCGVTGPQRADVMAALEREQARGSRTIAFARMKDAEVGMEPGVDGFSPEYCGFVAISDPVREDVPAAMKRVRGAGVEVVMVTGDVRETAIAVARDSGLLDAGCEDCVTVSGEEFEAMTEEQRLDMCQKVQVMYRARPASKLALVKALQQKGEVVAVTGDGTNDGPAMAASHVSFSMGKSGTAVAREASDVVLLEDSFSDIGTAIMWGRSLYRNIQRFITFQLTTNVATLAIALIGPFMGIALPLTVTQLLWVNLIMDTLAALALASEPPSEAVMQDSPRDPGAFIITGEMLKYIFGIGGAFVLVLMVMLRTMDMGDPAGLTIFFTVFVLLQAYNLFNVRMLGKTGSGFTGFGESKAFVSVACVVFVGQVLIVQFGGEVFRVVPLSMFQWAGLLAATSVVAVAGEAKRMGWVSRALAATRK